MTSILQQVSFLEINIPYVCKRTNETYVIPDWLLKMNRVKIFRCEDNGPITKILDTLKRNNNAYIFIMDDDTYYHRTMVGDLLKESKPSRAVCTSGIRFANGSYSQVPDGPVEVMEGFGGILLPPYKYKDFEYFDFALTNADCFLGDDVVISNWLKKLGFELWKANTPMPSQLEFGLSDPQALHKQNDMSQRYYRIIKWLHNNKILYITTHEDNYESD